MRELFTLYERPDANVGNEYRTCGDSAALFNSGVKFGRHETFRDEAKAVERARKLSMYRRRRYVVILDHVDRVVCTARGGQVEYGASDPHARRPGEPR